MRIHQLREGYEILSPIDREKYQERDGLEGPIMTRSGKVVYYDPKEGSYYDPDTDMYISYDDWKKLDSENMHKIDMDEGKSKQLHDIQWPDTDEDGDSEMATHAMNAIRHNFPAYDAYGHVYSMTRHRDWLEDNKEELIDMFAGYGLPMDYDESVTEDCDCECGEDPCKECGKKHHEEVDEGLTDIVKSVGSTFKRGFKSLTNRVNRPAKPPQPNQHTKRVKPGGNRPSLAKQINWGGDYNESTENTAMDKALRSIEKTFGGERKSINDQVTAMCRAADMLGSDRFKDRAFSVVEQYGINSKHELIQELHMMIKNEAAIDDDEIYGADTNIKMMKNAITKLRKADESLGEETIKYEDEYDTPVVIEIDKDKFMYNGNPITNYDWNNSAKAILTPGMHQKAKSWEEVHQYLSRFLGNPAGLQSACRQVFDMNDEGCKVNETVMVSEAQFDEAAGKKDACYHKVKSRYKVWPSAYASGALVKCRKVGAANWGKSKKK